MIATCPSWKVPIAECSGVDGCGYGYGYADGADGDDGIAMLIDVFGGSTANLSTPSRGAAAPLPFGPLL